MQVLKRLHVSRTLDSQIIYPKLENYRNLDAVQIYRIREIKNSSYRAYYGRKDFSMNIVLCSRSLYFLGTPEVEIFVKVFGMSQPRVVPIILIPFRLL
jgi:hypothetical protein